MHGDSTTLTAAPQVYQYRQDPWVLWYGYSLQRAMRCSTHQTSPETWRSWYVEVSSAISCHMDHDQIHRTWVCVIRAHGSSHDNNSIQCCSASHSVFPVAAVYATTETCQLGDTRNMTASGSMCVSLSRIVTLSYSTTTTALYTLTVVSYPL